MLLIAHVDKMSNIIQSIKIQTDLLLFFSWMFQNKFGMIPVAARGLQ